MPTKWSINSLDGRQPPEFQLCGFRKINYFARAMRRYMKMNITSLFGGLFLMLCLCAFSGTLQAQDSLVVKPTDELKIKKHTVLEKYESDFVISPEDRLQLKKDRLAYIQKRRSIIDTLNISKRKKRRLLKELYRTPFSDEWQKVIADIEFEEEY